MWYEAMIPFGIVCVLMTLPDAFCFASRTIFLGNPYKRSGKEAFDMFNIFRDNRITGNKLWETKGLEQIPDEE